MAKLWQLVGTLFVLVAFAAAKPAEDGDSVISVTAENEVDSAPGTDPKKPKFTVQETGTTEDRDHLLADLLTKGYNKKNYPNSADVQFGVNLLRFDVNEQDSSLTADTYLRYQWIDSRLKWNPEDYGNHTVIRVDSGDIWKPDITLYNSAANPGAPRCSVTYSIVYSTGKVIIVPACQERPFCNLTLTQRPFEEQTCVFKYGSWVFDGNTMDVQMFGEPKIAVDGYTPSPEWKITGNSAKRVEKFYDCCKEPYITLEFELKFQRRDGTTDE